MRFDNDSDFGQNIGRAGSGGGGFGGGGNVLGLLVPLVLSRFGIVGLLILALGYCALSTLGGGGSPALVSGSPAGAPAAQRTLTPQEIQQVCTADRAVRFACLTYESTVQVWEQVFQANGQMFDPPTLFPFNRAAPSACGSASAATGPFYCPRDQGIYLDTSFFNELSQRFGAPGDFAAAYVIAHEMGHHIQNLTGTLERARSLQSRSSEAEGNRVQVGVELQADCLAGVWAANARLSGEIIEPGDLEEGLRAAAAIGDDALQRQAQGYVVPESFTHGTSAQRQQALNLGFQSGRPETCLAYTQGT